MGSISTKHGILVSMRFLGDVTGVESSWERLRERLRLDCRECEVICEKVVSPWRCLRLGCRFIYVYDDRGTRYFGCLQKVFLPELDLQAVTRGNGHSGRAHDPYGHLRVYRPPLPHCPVSVEQAYEALYSPTGCCNPTFFHRLTGPEEDRIRLRARVGRRRRTDLDCDHDAASDC